MWFLQSLKPAVILCIVVWFIRCLSCIQYSVFHCKKYLASISHFFLTKSSLYIHCRTGSQRFTKLLSFNSLLQRWLTSIDHETFCTVTKPIFASRDKLTSTTFKFGGQKVLTHIQEQLLHPKKVAGWCDFTVTFFIPLFFPSLKKNSATAI